MTYSIIFAPEAFAQLDALEAYIAASDAPLAAKRFVDEIVDYCLRFDQFPMRGVAREDLRPGLRLVGYRRRATIAFSVKPDRVDILGVFYGGQNIEATFGADD